MNVRMKIDVDALMEWVGRTKTCSDVACAKPVRALSALLDCDDGEPQAGDPIPPCWHWLYFLPLYRSAEIGLDGHPLRGHFLPPVELPRRMWAGSRIAFLRPIAVGSAISRLSRILDVKAKVGRTGPLAFVRVLHEIGDAGGLALKEEQEIVFRELPSPNDPLPEARPAPLNAQWTQLIHPDEVLLFRYSALTFNGHRIHYDRRYAEKVEGYPGLVVHGPLIATLMLELLRRNLPDARVTNFSFRALTPTFDVNTFQVCGCQDSNGESVRLWAKHNDGRLAMDATAVLERPRFQ